jgi:tetratricopeptide (TPR) repeat protein
MRKSAIALPAVFLALVSLMPVSCGESNAGPSKETISLINLKRGEVITCGNTDKQFGSVAFDISGSEKVKQDFNLAIKLLHSFEYDEAEKVFARIIDEEPACAMAYWGVAMSNYHPLWTPPTEPELKKGAKAIVIAQAIGKKSAREAAYIDAIAAYYMNWNTVDHRTRTIAFEKAMEKLYADYPGDIETAIFYTLALNAAADPTDKSFAKQKKAASILNALYTAHPNHPGIVHYIIHTYDYPGLAELALPAARKYAAVAPSSSHALHMSSHIFTRLGLWEEGIQSNLAAAASAKCYAETAGIKGHWDEELHALDYLVYGYLQKGENGLAKAQYDYLKTIREVHPVNFKVAYAFAAIPSRYMLENRMWKEVAILESDLPGLSWQQFPWQRAILHFARLLGNAHTGNSGAAHTEWKTLQMLYDTLMGQKDIYKASQVQIQLKAGEAWLRLMEGKNQEALVLMHAAADLEDKTEKHPVTPGEVIPARELLGDMLLQMNKPAEALAAYEASLQTHPNRFNGLYGAGLAAERSGNKEKADQYYRQLLAVANSANANRPELTTVKQFLKERRVAPVQ